jgi:uncharacterized damage-inducible protein DinB
MSDPMLDAFRHNTWATRVLIEFCRGLDEMQLDAGSPGAFGSILETWRQLVTSEGYYTSLFLGSLPKWDTSDYDGIGLDQLAAWAAELEPMWESVLAAGIDGDAWLKRRRSDGSISEVRAGVMLAQALHHSNVHREQISAALTGLGLTPPDVSGWGYGRETGGFRPV